MPDRRQGDRRDSSKSQKKITISLSSFIFIIVIFILIITSCILCSYLSKLKYDEGYIQGYEDAYNDYWYTDYQEDFLYDSDEIILDDYAENSQQ